MQGLLNYILSDIKKGITKGVLFPQEVSNHIARLSLMIIWNGGIKYRRQNSAKRRKNCKGIGLQSNRACLEYGISSAELSDYLGQRTALLKVRDKMDGLLEEDKAQD